MPDQSLLKEARSLPLTLPDALASAFDRHDIPPVAQLDQMVVELKRWQKTHPDRKAQGYYDRVQRACSWLAKAKRSSDPEAGFIFSWIALNALCGIRAEIVKTDWWKREERSCPSHDEQQYDEPVPREPRELEWFLWRICGLDIGPGTLRRVIEDEGNWAAAKAILGTRYLMSNFWSWKWQTQNDLAILTRRSERIVKDAIGIAGDRRTIYLGLCEIIVWRLRVLRNQLFHGCATDTHSKRRADGPSELEAGWRLLGELVWAFLRLMATETARALYWPPIPYPRAGSEQHHRFDQAWLPVTSAGTMPNFRLQRQAPRVARHRR